MKFEDLPIYCKIEILIQCEHLSFVFLSRVNKELSNLFHGRITKKHGNLKERLFHERSLKYLSEYIKYKNMEPNITWKNFYGRIIKWTYYEKNYQCIKNFILNNQLMEIVMCADHNLRIYNEYANLACKQGHYNILRYFYYKYNILPNIGCINYATGKGNIKIIEWLETIGQLPDKDGANYALSVLNFEMCDWLYKRNIYPDTLKFSCKTDKDKILKWIKEKNIILKLIGKKEIKLKYHINNL